MKDSLNDFCEVITNWLPRTIEGFNYERTNEHIIIEVDKGNNRFLFTLSDQFKLETIEFFNIRDDVFCENVFVFNYKDLYRDYLNFNLLERLLKEKYVEWSNHELKEATEKFNKLLVQKCNSASEQKSEVKT